MLRHVVFNSGMHHGEEFDTFPAGSGDPWQLFINNDMVTGLLFMVGWMIFREQGGRAPFQQCGLRSMNNLAIAEYSSHVS